MKSKQQILSFALCWASSLVLITLAQAHYLWLKAPVVDGRRQVFLHFGENPADENYRLPEALAKTEIWRRTPDGKRTRLDAKQTAENEKRIGLAAALSGDSACVLEASAVYGNYHGMLLTYGAKHVHASALEEINSFDESKELKLDIVPTVRGDELRLTVLWNGEPLPDATVAVAVGDAERSELKTNKNGRVSFRPERDGFISVLANRRDAEAKGEHQGEAYTGEMNFASLTLDWKKPEVFARLPEPLASFGAAVADGWLYVYGGHVGEPHDHSAANLSQHFRRMRLGGTGVAPANDDDEFGVTLNEDVSFAGPSTWEELPMQTPLQGVAMVAHGERVYRVGGMIARNATTDAEEDMHSTDEFAGYDPKARESTALPPLPAPRSSHDAVVIGDTLFVVGGWKLAGKGKGEWQKDLLAFNLAESFKTQPKWAKLPAMPSARRAVAAGGWRGKLVVIGGIDEEGAVSRDSSIYDPLTGAWTDGPQLPEGDLAGFGVSAWNLDGRLYVSGLPGVLYRLSDDGQKWEEAARLKTPRFFHRLLPGSVPTTILAVAGSAEDGHVADIEVLDVR